MISWGCQRPNRTWNCWGWHPCCKRRHERQINRTRVCRKTPKPKGYLLAEPAELVDVVLSGVVDMLGGGKDRDAALTLEKKKAKFDHVNLILYASLLTFILSPEGMTSPAQLHLSAGASCK